MFINQTFRLTHEEGRHIGTCSKTFHLINSTSCDGLSQVPAGCMTYIPPVSQDFKHHTTPGLFQATGRRPQRVGFFSFNDTSTLLLTFHGRLPRASACLCHPGG